MKQDTQHNKCIIKLYLTLLIKVSIPTGHVLFFESFQSCLASLYWTAYFRVGRPPLSAGPMKENVIVVAATYQSWQYHQSLIQSDPKVMQPINPLLEKIMLVVILILYVDTTVFPPRHRCWATLTSSCTPSVECHKIFFSQDQRVFIVEHYFSTGPPLWSSG
jgi:hypothetical protein